jgi:putative solute:sodium symporter small subunit
MAHDPAARHHTAAETHMTDDDARRRASAYWRRNLLYVGILLGIWFLVSFGAGILFADTLNAFRVPGTGFPLGFWFAQQGSIYVFVILIFIYVFLMNRLDRKHGVEEDRLPRRSWRRREGSDAP